MGDPQRLQFRDPGYDGQLVRTVAMAPEHAADLGEALATARRIAKPSGVTWHDAWTRTATDATAAATAAKEAGDRVSARRAYLRASEYHRQSYYFLRGDLDDPRLLRAYREHVAAFRAAMALMDHPAAAVTIPYEGTTLNGNFFAPDDSGQPRPTLVFPAGYDSTAASWPDAAGALARGYNALVVEGPGQGGVLYEQRLHLRPDWEHVLTPVLDWLVGRSEVDPGRIVLVGRSFGGYLAPRAAAYEQRVAALVCDPAQPRMSVRIPSGLAGRIAAPVVRGQMRFNADRAEFFRSRMAAHGLHSVGAYFAELRRYDMLGVADQIHCPTLIIEAEDDFAGGSGAQLRDAMSAPAELVHLTAAQGANGHCAGLGQEIWAGTVHPWLRRVLGS
jgi:pimeloyl-ACP methyl ester carboxylesterase